MTTPDREETENETLATDISQAGTAQEVSLRKRFFNIKTGTSFAIAFAILFFLFTRLDVNFQAVWENVKRSNPILYMLSFIVYYMSFVLRGGRWRVLLENVGFRRSRGVKLPSVWGLGEIIFLSWFANCIVPAKLGDAYRAYLLKSGTNVSFSKTVGTILAERVIDLVILFTLLLGAAFWVIRGRNTAAAVGIVEVGLGFIVVLIIGLIALKLLGSRIQRLIPSRFHLAYAHFLEGILGSFYQIPRLIFITMLIWLMEVGRLLFVTQSMGITLAFSLVIFVALAHSLLTAIPFTPGGLGIAEAGLVGLLMIAVSKENAISIAILDRVVSYWSIIFFGLIIFLFRRRRRLDL